jgi:hypothetical protein
MTYWLTPLSEAGATSWIVPSISGNTISREIDGTEGLNCAGWAKKRTGEATINVGSRGSDCDFIAAFGGESAVMKVLDNLRADRTQMVARDAIGRVLVSSG